MPAIFLSYSNQDMFSNEIFNPMNQYSVSLYSKVIMVTQQITQHPLESLFRTNLVMIVL